jgi:hypothetical protein
MIPSPTKTQIKGDIVHCSLFESGIVHRLTGQECDKRLNDGNLVLPLTFVAKCKDMLTKNVDQIRSWFNPAPSASTIQNVTHLPESIPWNKEQSHSVKNVIIRVKGIIVESNRILPYITLDIEKQTIQNLTDTLNVTSLNDDSEIEEITDDIIVRDITDDEDDDDDDDDEDEDEDEDDRFERVQRNLDAARDELERLRRKHYRS